MFRKVFILISLVLIFNGCITIDPAGKRMVKTDWIQEGMTTEYVSSVLGQEVVVGYQKQDDIFEPIVIQNPKRRQKIKRHNKIYDVLFYFDQIRTPDGEITDDELIPLVFFDGKLVGKGWGYFKGLQNEVYE